VGTRTGYDGDGHGMVHTWLVLLPSLLRYPHTYPLAAAPYILVVFVDTKKLKQQHRESSEPANAHSRFLTAYPPSLPHDKHFLGGSIYSSTRVRFDLSGRKDRDSNSGTCVDSLPMSSRTYRRPFISFNCNDNLCPRRR
jgi:hypothetical protein